jgi:hypothetical protein
MPSRLRVLFDQIGVIAALAGAFAASWIAATGTYRPPLWVNPLAAAAVMALASLLEHAATSTMRARLAPARHRKGPR